MSDKTSCLKHRKVSSCEKCIRYHECKNHATEFSNDLGVAKLGMLILVSLVEDYVECWQKGYKNHINSYDKILSTQYPTIISGGKFDGIPIMEGLRQRCSREYGTLEETNKTMKQNVMKKINTLIEKRKLATSKMQKFDLTNKINRLKGELNY